MLGVLFGCFTPLQVMRKVTRGNKHVAGQHMEAAGVRKALDEQFIAGAGGEGSRGGLIPTRFYFGDFAAGGSSLFALQQGKAHQHYFTIDVRHDSEFGRKETILTANIVCQMSLLEILDQSLIFSHLFRPFLVWGGGA